MKIYIHILAILIKKSWGLCYMLGSCGIISAIRVSEVLMDSRGREEAPSELIGNEDSGISIPFATCVF